MLPRIITLCTFYPKPALSILPGFCMLFRNLVLKIRVHKYLDNRVKASQDKKKGYNRTWRWNKRTLNSFIQPRVTACTCVYASIYDWILFLFQRKRRNSSEKIGKQKQATKGLSRLVLFLAESGLQLTV